MKGFAIIPILIAVSVSIVGSFIGVGLFLKSEMPEMNQPQNLGTATTTQFTGHLLPIGTSTLLYSVGTTSESGDRRYRHAQLDYATTVSQDVYDELKIGRSATTTITEGTITTTDLTVTGTCTGCSGSVSVDLQDTYNNSASDANILLADAKDVILTLADTATDPNFQISVASDAQGQLQLLVGSTTNAVWDGYGRLGIGTTTPGAGLSVQATTTILGLDAYVFGQLTVPHIVATNTAGVSLFLGDIGSSAQRVPNIWATNINSTLLTVGAYAQGDLTVTGDLYVNGNNFNLGTGSATSTYVGDATSTMQAGFLFGSAASTGGVRINTGGLTLVGGDALFSNALKSSFIGTSTFTGNLSAASLAGSAGLTLTGDVLLSGKLVQSTANATSSFAGGLTASSSLAVSGRVAATPLGGCQSGSGLINFADGTGGCISVTGDTTISVENALPNQVFRLWIYHDHTGANSDLAWATATNGYLFYFPNGEATTTSSLAGALDICNLSVSPTSTTPLLIAVSCGANWSQANP